MFYFHFFHYFLSPTFSVSLKLLVPHAFNSCLSGPSVCQILLREKQRNLASDKATAWANHSPARTRCLENCKLVPLLGHRQCPDGGEAVQIPMQTMALWNLKTDNPELSTSALSTQNEPLRFDRISYREPRCQELLSEACFGIIHEEKKKIFRFVA